MSKLLSHLAESVYDAGSPKVEIKNKESQDGRTVYLVKIGRRHPIRRRYQQFWEFHYLLRMKFPQFKNAKFPSTGMLTVFSNVFDLENLERSRMRDLARWLEGVLANTEIRRWDETKKFIADADYSSGLSTGVGAKLKRKVGLERFEVSEGLTGELLSGKRRLPATDFPRWPPAKMALGKKHNLWVTMVSGHDLVAMDRGGTSDPYAEVELKDSQLSMLDGNVFTNHSSTSVVKKSLNPVWNHTMCFSFRDASTANLFIKVKDSDFGAIDDKLGTKEIGVDVFEDGQIYDRWYHLDGAVSGMIHCIFWVEDLWIKEYTDAAKELLKKHEEWGAAAKPYEAIHCVPLADWRVWENDDTAPSRGAVSWAIDMAVVVLTRQENGWAKNALQLHYVSFIAEDHKGRHLPFSRFESYGVPIDFNPTQVPPPIYETIKDLFPNAATHKHAHPPVGAVVQ